MSNFNPLVSVILPTYNRAHVLGKAIESILNQTYSNFEIIIVDDGSLDSTEKLVARYRDNRIKYIRHTKNQGAVAARNTGIVASKGEYIAFQDSDNEWLPEKLEKQIAAFNSGPPNLGVVYTSVWIIDKGTKIRIPSLNMKKTDGEIHELLLEGNFIDTSTALVKRVCLNGSVCSKSARLQNGAMVKFRNIIVSST
jgi:glycosyltransferase involved in cell wall biosynthesis